MRSIQELLAIMASQIKRSGVTLATVEKPHKIKDDNQSIHNGVINETIESDLRSQSQPNTERK
jgi:hypothetical protein